MWLTGNPRNTTLVAVGLRAGHENGGKPAVASTLPLTFDGKARPSSTGGRGCFPIFNFFAVASLAG